MVTEVAEGVDDGEEGEGPIERLWRELAFMQQPEPGAWRWVNRVAAKLGYRREERTAGNFRRPKVKAGLSLMPTTRTDQGRTQVASALVWQQIKTKRQRMFQPASRFPSSAGLAPRRGPSLL